MQIVLQIAVLLLMVSIGMGLRLGELFACWRRLDLLAWASLVGATFIIPPAVALLVARLFHLTAPETAGLFMIAVAPGAPLLTRNLARRGFDMHLAASYQVWAALMVPIMIPILVLLAGKLYGRNIWIPPLVLLHQIALKQFLPLTVGILIVWLAPATSQRYAQTVNAAGNIILLLLMIAVLIKLGVALKDVTPLVPLAAMILAAASIESILLLRFNHAVTKQTFAICNANRHVGLALLLTGQYVTTQNALPTIACYAVLAPVLMFVYVRFVRRV